MAIDDLNSINFGENSKNINDTNVALESTVKYLNELIQKHKELLKGVINGTEEYRKTKSFAESLVGLTKDQILNRSTLRKLNTDISNILKKIHKDELTIANLEERKNTATRHQKNTLDAIIRTRSNQIIQQRELLHYAELYRDASQNAREGIIGTVESIEDIIKTIPGVNRIFGGFFGRLITDIKKVYVEGGGVGASIMTSLKRVVPLGIALGLAQLIRQAVEVNKEVTELSKNLLITYKDGNKVRKTFIDIANSSGDTSIFYDRILKANNAINKELGFFKVLSYDINTQFSRLVNNMGVSEESAAKLAKATIATGGSLEHNADVMAGIVSSVSSQRGVQLSVRDIVEETGKYADEMLTTFKGNPIELAKAVIQAKALGTNLSNVSKQADQILNFESSIESTLKASLLTGKLINLEKARELALNNRLGDLAGELVDRGMSFNEFSNLNRIQQSALSESLGLSTSELSDQLLLLEAQRRSFSDIETLNGKAARHRAEQLSAQERFNNAVEKLQDIFVRIIEGPIGELLDWTTSMLENIGKINKFFKGKDIQSLNNNIQYTPNRKEANSDIGMALKKLIEIQERNLNKQVYVKPSELVQPNFIASSKNQFYAI